MRTATDRVFKAIELLKSIGKVRFYADVYRVMEMERGGFNQVKRRDYDFTVKQIYLFINHYNINANYVFRNEERMFYNKN